MPDDALDRPPRGHHGYDRGDYVEIQGPEDIPLPAWLTDEYRPCMDCLANMFLRWTGTRWNVTVAHDESCPFFEQLAEGGVSEGDASTLHPERFYVPGFGYHAPSCRMWQLSPSERRGRCDCV